MSIEQKIGQMVMFGFPGYTLSKETRNFFEKHYIGNFILFERNYKSVQQLVELTTDLHGISKDFIPIIAVDQEGGRVIRFKKPFTSLPSAQTIGRIIKNNEKAIKISYEIGKILGSELSAVGVNMNLAPVLDILTNERNSVIGDRSYGADPLLVSQIGLSLVAGMQDQKVIACGKHFPGHGDTEVDSHKGLPVVHHDIKRLWTRELRPFNHCIKNGMLAIMSSHVKYDKIDDKFPASLSEKIIGKLLRKAMGFTGIVLTDDLGMGAIKKNYKITEAGVLSVKAGNDIVMVCNDIEEQKRVYDALCEAVIKKEIEEYKINEAVGRILRIKRQFLEPFKPDGKREKEVIGSEANQKFVESLISLSKGIV